MSFSQNAKVEITKRKISKPCCRLAACYGIACFGKYFDNRGLVLQTETEEVAKFALKTFHSMGVEGTVLCKERPNGAIYEFSVSHPKEVEKMMKLLDCTGTETNLRIRPQLLQCGNCLRTFVAAAFLCGGTITDPEKTYQLEFISNRYNLSRDFEALLAEHEFRPRRTQRKGTNIVYIKASESIEDLLVFMGAQNAAMVMMDRKIYKDTNNKNNRLNNCENANNMKRDKATQKVQQAIRLLEEEGLLTDLPQPLQEAAQKRLAYPQYTLAQLAESFDPPISKSGLSHRLKKLEELARTAAVRRENV